MVRPLREPELSLGTIRGAGPLAVSEKSVPQVPLPVAPDRRDAPELGPSDHELIRAAQRGEERAFAELVQRHEERAVRVALALIANREDARDLAQEAFLRVFRNLERFDFQHEFTTWLYRIVTNLAIDLLRKRRPA